MCFVETETNVWFNYVLLTLRASVFMLPYIIDYAVKVAGGYRCLGIFEDKSKCT